jgi:hypothetical protein
MDPTITVLLPIFALPGVLSMRAIVDIFVELSPRWCRGLHVVTAAVLVSLGYLVFLAVAFRHDPHDSCFSPA